MALDARGTLAVEDDRRVADAFSELAPKLRAALTPLADAHAVDDAIAEAFVYLCAHPEKVLSMDNPGGYLYRVARNRLRHHRRTPLLPPVPDAVLPQVEPGLPAALASLTEKQRVVVFLIAGMDWKAGEVAEYLELAETSVRTHYDRGIAKLRARLGKVES